MAYVMQVHCPNHADDAVTVVDHVKLFRNGRGLCFEGRIHEQVIPSIRRVDGRIEWTDLFVVHSGSDQTASGRLAKTERDLRLLELDLADRPEHPFVLFNLGMTHDAVGNNERALGYLARSISVSGPEESHLRKAYAIYASSLTSLGRHAAAHKLAAKGVELFPEDHELWFRCGMAAHHLGKLDEAVAAYERALAPADGRYFASMDPAIAGYKARHNLALVLQELGLHERAAAEWRCVLDEKPLFAPAYRPLASCLLAINEGEKAAELVAAALASDTLRPEARLIEADLAEHQRDHDRLLEILRAIVNEFPSHLPTLEAHARCAFLYGADLEAESALFRLLSRRPDDPATLSNLGMVYLRMGHHAAAADRLRESLALRPDSTETQQHLETALAKLQPDAAHAT